MFPELTVHRQILLGAYTRRGSSIARAEVEALLKRSRGCASGINSRAGLLSGGEQQMLAIARGLMAKPRILLLDEPSLGLAPAMINELFDVLAELRDDGVTILLVDQMAALALTVADRGYVLESGSIVRDDTAEALAHDPGAGGRLSRQARSGQLTMARDFILRNAGIAGRDGQTLRHRRSRRRDRRHRAAHRVRCAKRGRRRPARRRRASSTRHIHLDKSCILDRCRIGAGHACRRRSRRSPPPSAPSPRKTSMRAPRRTLEKAIVQGTTRMRTHVEVDPRIGLTQLQRDPAS